jgi:O-antigen/teichoic acid export membrane protein
VTVSAVDATEGIAKDAGRSAGKIGVSLLISIGLGYLLTWAAARLLNTADSAVFLTFWGLLMGLGSALSPIEQELSRQSATAALTGGRAGRSALRAITVGIAVVVVAGLVAMVPPIRERLFGDHFSLPVIVLVGGIAFACQFGARGLLIGQHQVKHFSLLVIAEAGARVLVLGILVLAAATGLVTLALAVAAGSFAWLLFVRPTAKLVDSSTDGESWRIITPRMLLLIAASALTASVITGYAPMVRLLAPGADAAKLAALLLALTVARVPLLLLQPLQSMAVPLVIRLSGSDEGKAKLRRVLAGGTLGALVLGVVGALVGFLIGPWAVSFVYGAKYQVADWAVAGLVWSAVLLVPMQLLTAVLVARTQANRVLVTWAVVAATAAAILLFGPGDPILRAVVGLAVAPTVGLAVVLVFVLRRTQVAGNAEAPETSR